MKEHILLNHILFIIYLLFCYISIKYLILKREASSLKEAVKSLSSGIKDKGRLSFISPDISSIWNFVYAINARNINEKANNEIYNDILNLGTTITSAANKKDALTQTIAQIILEKTSPEVVSVCILKFNKGTKNFTLESSAGFFEKRLESIIPLQLEELLYDSLLTGNFSNWGYQFTGNDNKFNLSSIGINLTLSIPLEENNSLVAALWLGIKNQAAILDPQRANLLKGICQHCAASMKLSDKIKNDLDFHTQEREIFLGVSHDLKIPGNSALLVIDELEKSLSKASKKQKNLICILKNSIEQQIEILENVLDVAKEKAGTLKAHAINISLRNILEEIISNYPFSKRDKVNFTHEDIPDVRIHFDPLSLKRIFCNLLSNAFKYTDEGGVYLTFKVTENFVSIKIIDTGIGIPEDQQNNLFQNFKRFENGKAIPGSGIGLSSSFKLAKINNSKLSYEKNVPNGSVFELKIPLVKDKIIEKIIEKALIIDDDVLMQKTTKRYLKNHIEEIFLASNCEEAIRIIDNNNLNLIITDINLENSNIEAVLEHIKTTKQNLPILLVSGESSDNILKKYQNSLELKYLQKPINRASLIEGFREICKSI